MKDDVVTAIERAPSLGELLGPAVESEDRSGRTKLDVLADELNDLSNDDVRKRNWAREVVAIAGMLDRLSIVAVKRLCRFIESAGLRFEDIGRRYRGAIRQRLGDDKDTEKRGEIFRMLCAIGDRPTPLALQRDAALRVKFPWLWIDSMQAVNWPAADARIVETLKSEGTPDNLLPRLPALWATNKQAMDSAQNWLSALPSPAAREKLIRWLDRRQIAIPDQFGVIAPEHEAFLKSVKPKIELP